MPTDNEVISALRDWLRGQRNDIRIGHHFYRKDFLEECINDMERLKLISKVDDEINPLTRLGMIILYSETGIEHNFKLKDANEELRSSAV